jgi:hypothetical protein
MHQPPATPVAAAQDWQLLMELRTVALAADDPMAVEQRQGQQQLEPQAAEEAGTPAYRTYSLFGSGSGFGSGEWRCWAGGECTYCSTG